MLKETKIRLQHFGLNVGSIMEQYFCSKCGEVLLNEEIGSYEGKCLNCYIDLCGEIYNK